MKSKVRASRIELGKISLTTLGSIRGEVEAVGLYTPQIQLS